MTLGIAPDGTVAGLAISRLDQTETPGLGVKVTRAAFREQFRGKGAGAARLKQDGGTVDAITAATISSRAVADGVREALGWYGETSRRGPGDRPVARERSALQVFRAGSSRRTRPSSS